MAATTSTTPPAPPRAAPAPHAPPHAARSALALEFAAAAQALELTLAGMHLDQALDRLCASLPAASRPAVRDITYATVRDLAHARFIAARFNKRPPPPATAALQLVAITQLRDGRRPAAVVVDQAVAAARAADDAGLRAAAGFLNATLRRYAGDRAALDAAAARDPEAASGHPRWWLELLQSAYPGQWREIVAESLRQAPMTLRVNRRQLDLAAGQAALAAAGIASTITGASALTLASAVPVSAIPGFDRGHFTVQDAGAQLAAPLLDVRDGHRVLDACAAPGGKTTQLLQAHDCRVLALDVDAGRTASIRENLAREQLPLIDWADRSAGWGAAVRAVDAAATADWWDGEPFDRILLDAPCSASGIVRRHPDVLWHRRRSDPTTFGRQQQALLRALWPLLKPGGKLLYVTCSIFPQEGEAVINAFRSQYRNCEPEPIVAPWADGDMPLLAQLLPTSTAQRNHDGYYFALLNKQT